MYDAIGRVIVPAAQLEHALATLAQAALGSGEANFQKTHGQPPSTLRDWILTEANARPQEWWSTKTLALLPRLFEALDLRHAVVHGYWSDLETLVVGSGYMVMKPERVSKNWSGRRFNLDQLLEFGVSLQELLSELRPIADRLLDEAERRTPAGLR